MTPPDCIVCGCGVATQFAGAVRSPAGGWAHRDCVFWWVDLLSEKNASGVRTKQEDIDRGFCIDLFLTGAEARRHDADDPQEQD